MSCSRNTLGMISHLSFSIAPWRLFVFATLLVAGLAGAMSAEAATSQITATPSTISAGQSTNISWSCPGAVSAYLYTNEGSYPVALSGSDTFQPTASYQYRVVCTYSSSSGGANVWVYVEEGACYTDWSSSVDGDAVYTTFDESNKVLDTLVLDGQGYDSSNYYQQCISACLSTETKRCNESIERQPMSGEIGLITMRCSLAVPGTSLQSKPQYTQYNTSGDIVDEKTYYNIAWSQASGGTCTPAPPMPTVDLVATPTSISSGGTSKLTWTSTNADECNGTSFSTGGAANNATTGVNVTPAATKDYTITCINSTGTVSDTVRVTVGSNPDLTAGAITPTTVTSGAATTLSSTISNIGAATTTSSFSVEFERATSSKGSNASLLGTTSTPILGKSASRSVAYTTSASAFPTAGTWYVRACADKRFIADANGTVVESNENNNCGAWTPVTANAGTNYPNLTAGTPSPGSATVNTATTFSSAVTNASATSTGKTFTNVFQFDNDSNHASVYASMTDNSPILAANGTDNASVSYTFTSVGQWYVRACADNNSSMSGTITESNEGDNCSGWRAVTVDVSGSSATLTCTAAPTTVAVGGTVTYTASPSNLGPFAYRWIPSDGSTVSAKSYSITKTWNTAGYFGMTVTNAVGSIEGSCPVVTVGNPCGAASATITASPNRVSSGGTSTLTVSADGINGSCTVVGPGVNQTIVADTCSVADTDIATPAITVQSVYTLTCTGATAVTAIVNVIPKFQEF